jgi:hypothetical protein
VAARPLPYMLTWDETLGQSVTVRQSVTSGLWEWRWWGEAEVRSDKDMGWWWGGGKVVMRRDESRRENGWWHGGGGGSGVGGVGLLEGDSVGKGNKWSRE